METEKCPICGEEMVPDDRIIQVRVGGFEDVGDYLEFIPYEDLNYYHADCFSKVEFPTSYAND